MWQNLKVVIADQISKNNYWFLKSKSQKTTDLEAFTPIWGFSDVEHISYIIAEGIS